MRRRFKFSHQANGRYYWYSVQPLRGDSRHEEISCSVQWYWRKEG